jgi:SAM-dependent methyltransferase
MSDSKILVKTPIACPVCKGTEFTVRYPDELGERPALVDYDFKPETQLVYQIVDCTNCKFIYTNPVPDLGPAYTDTVDHVYLSTIAQRAKTARRDVERLKDKIKSGRILDIGCNAGIFLNAAADAGFEVEGIELSDWSRSEAAKRHKVYGQTLDELNFHERYDAITLWGVIEHLSAPDHVIELTYKALKPGGYIFIYTGDADSIVARLMGRRWYWYMGMHLMYFSKSTLQRMLARLGFADMKYVTHTSYFSLGSLAVSLRRYPSLAPIVWLLQRPSIAKLFVALTIPGEMLMIARKSG